MFALGIIHGRNGPDDPLGHIQFVVKGDLGRDRWDRVGAAPSRLNRCRPLPSGSLAPGVGPEIQNYQKVGVKAVGKQTQRPHQINGKDGYLRHMRILISTVGMAPPGIPDTWEAWHRVEAHGPKRQSGSRTNWIHFPIRPGKVSSATPDLSRSPRPMAFMISYCS